MMQIKLNKYFLKIIVFVFVVILSPSFVSFSSYAYKDDNQAESQDEQENHAYDAWEEESGQIRTEIDKILASFKDILPSGAKDVSTPEEINDRIGFKFLFDSIVSSVKGGGVAFFSFFLMLFGLSMFISFVSQYEGELSRTAVSAISLVSSSIVLGTVFGIAGELSRSLKDINAFFAASIPICTSVNLIGLSTATASVQAAGMNVALWIVSAMTGEALFPFVGLVLLLSALGVLGGPIANAASKVKKAFMTVCGLLTLTVSLLFSLQNLISASMDNAAIKTAKYALSGMIPIVGGTVSGTLSTLTGAVGYVKGVVGGGAIVAVISVLLSPLITLLMYRLCFTLAGFFSGFAGDDGERFVTSLSGGFDMLIAVYALSAVVYVFQFAMFLKGGVSVA